MIKPTLEDFKDWQKHHVTEWVFEELELMRKDYCMAMGEGATLDHASPERTALLTAENAGFIDGLDALSKIEMREPK